ncbi:MAG: 3-dehydro-L-gulonate 2-dehydrogenase [Paenibacillus sp.]|nr:3-dehydro-L-gulonate 2-dehydrogenase [Paenibacillus sp.]
MMRIHYDAMKAQFQRVLNGLGFKEERAELCARLFADNSRDGVYSHGLNRFPSFVDSVRRGLIAIDAEPVKVDGMGAIERWDGQMGPGMINASRSMERAVALAREHGMGCVALRNTNHWMRAGSYGLLAAEAGCIGICWTNTIANIPPWGGKERKVGNNPIVLAVPGNGYPIVLDAALSQFSFGQLQSYTLRNEQLPVDGGYDKAGNPTRDPSAIMESGRVLPIGFWKGTGMSLLLDLIGMMLSGGKSTYDITQAGRSEYGVTQVFIAFDPSAFQDGTPPDKIDEILRDYQSAELAEGFDDIRYPSGDMRRRREENMRSGIPVEPSIWEQVLNMA